MILMGRMDKEANTQDNYEANSISKYRDLLPEYIKCLLYYTSLFQFHRQNSPSVLSRTNEKEISNAKSIAVDGMNTKNT